MTIARPRHWSTQATRRPWPLWETSPCSSIDERHGEAHVLWTHQGPCSNRHLTMKHVEAHRITGNSQQPTATRQQQQRGSNDGINSSQQAFMPSPQGQHFRYGMWYNVRGDGRPPKRLMLAANNVRKLPELTSSCC